MQPLDAEVEEAFQFFDSDQSNLDFATFVKMVQSLGNHQQLLGLQCSPRGGSQVGLPLRQTPRGSGARLEGSPRMPKPIVTRECNIYIHYTSRVCRTRGCMQPEPGVYASRDLVVR